MVMRSSVGMIIALFSVVSSASAQVLTLPPRTTGLSPIEGKITNIQVARIPKGDAITGTETRISLKFPLKGCLDTLMPLISNYEIQGRRATIYVTALNAHNEESRVANCIAMPEATAELKIPGMFQRNQIRIVYGKTIGESL